VKTRGVKEPGRRAGRSLADPGSFSDEDLPDRSDARAERPTAFLTRGPEGLLNELWAERSIRGSVKFGFSGVRPPSGGLR
jgi:hypothetical protein